MSKLELSSYEYFQNLHRLQTLGLTPPLLTPPQPSVLPPPYVSTPSPPHPPLTPLRPSPLSFLGQLRPEAADGIVFSSVLSVVPLSYLWGGDQLGVTCD